MDIKKTLDRIHYRGGLEPNLGTLRKLHRAFLLAIPFENLDIHLKKKISLEPEALYGKIVLRRRGGFCYECNGLFHELLKGLGFQVTMLSARMIEEGVPGPEFDHMVLRVDLEEPYLVDVGNGQSFRQPLRIDGTDLCRSEGYVYQVRSSHQGLALYCRESGNDWYPKYIFGLRRRSRDEFLEMCHYHQSSPKSMFTRRRLVTLATPDGRITLRERRLITRAGNEQKEALLRTDREYRACLRERFGIELFSDAEKLRAPKR